MTEKPTMHCQRELEEDLRHDGILPDATLLKWSRDQYSTSGHLLTLYAMARGLNAKTMLEIGFGRSTFVLAKAAHENGGELITCDYRDFSYLLSEKEKQITTFICGRSDDVWKSLNKGVDFAFLDYFSDATITEKFCVYEISKCVSFMRTNGLITIHDATKDEYSVEKSLKRISRSRNLELVSLPYWNGLAVIRSMEKSKYGIIEDTFIKKPDIKADS